jgi:hypothetical protein
MVGSVPSRLASGVGPLGTVIWLSIFLKVPKLPALSFISFNFSLWISGKLKNLKNDQTDLVSAGNCPPYRGLCLRQPELWCWL